MAKLNTPFRVKGLQLKNRIVMAPMCQYSVTAKDGMPNEWHYVHYVSRAIGGAGLIIVEMTDVEPNGRITDYDLGLWSDDHIEPFRKLVSAVHAHGAKIGIQIAHAGRKAEDAPIPVGPSTKPFPETREPKKYRQPKQLTEEEIARLVDAFQQAVRRAVEAGFDMIELHGAHGYLIHQFMSPSVNDRTDKYGKNLATFGVEVIRAAKEVMPATMPLFMRMSAMEYMDGGYSLNYALQIAAEYKEAGIDAFHISSGGEGPPGKRKPGNFPGFQVPYARAFKERFDLPVVAVGKLNDPAVAELVLNNDDADLIAIGRGMLNDPYWALHAIKQLTGSVEPPRQYRRGIY